MKLSAKRYEQIKETIADMYEDYGICSFPIDINSLAKCLNIKFIYETSYLEEFDDNEAPVEGCVLTDFNDMIHKVLIANWSTYRGKQTYTKCHEIGHIVLGHKPNSEEAESESDFFAGYTLAPSCLIMVDELRQILLDFPHLYPTLFGLSEEATKHAYNRFVQRLNCGAKLKEYELRILELFNNSIQDIIKKYKDYEI